VSQVRSTALDALTEVLKVWGKQATAGSKLMLRRLTVGQLCASRAPGPSVLSCGADSHLQDLHLCIRPRRCSGLRLHLRIQCRTYRNYHSRANDRSQRARRLLRAGQACQPNCRQTSPSSLAQWQRRRKAPWSGPR